MPFPGLVARGRCVAVPGAGVAGGHGTDFEDVAGRGREERRGESEMRRGHDWGSRGAITDRHEGYLCHGMIARANRDHGG